VEARRIELPNLLHAMHPFGRPSRQAGVADRHVAMPGHCVAPKVDKSDMRAGSMWSALCRTMVAWCEASFVHVRGFGGRAAGTQRIKPVEWGGSFQSLGRGSAADAELVADRHDPRRVDVDFEQILRR
jgi:hypothetical protein